MLYNKLTKIERVNKKWILIKLCFSQLLHLQNLEYYQTIKISLISYKKQYNMVEEFYFNYYKEILEIAVEHGLDKLFELGFSLGELYNVFAHLNRNSY